MKPTAEQETSMLIASRAMQRAQHAIGEAERLDELTLYMTQRTKWIEQTAPKTAALMKSWSDETALDTWNRIGPDYKREVWKYLDADQRARLRRLKEAA